MTDEDWKTSRASMRRGTLARIELTDIEADALVGVGMKALANEPVETRAALARAIAKVKLARAAMPLSQADIERGKRGR